MAPANPLKKRKVSATALHSNASYIVTTKSARRSAMPHGREVLQQGQARELRLQIFEYNIPIGPVPFGRVYDYGAAFDLFRVNKQINAEISIFLYGSLSRVCRVRIDMTGFHMLGARYGLELFHNRATEPHSSQVFQYRLDRIAHFAFEIVGYNLCRGGGFDIHRGERKLFESIANI